MKIFIIIFGVFLMVGCATNTQSEVYIATSSPIYIDKKLPSKNVFVKFNTSDGNLTKVVENHLQNSGYNIVSENLADIKIKGNMNFFRKNADTTPSIFMDMGFGFGRHFRGTSFGFGYRTSPFYDDYRNGEFFYDAQVSLFIFVGEQNYSTNLNIQSAKSNLEPSKEKILEIFNEKIANKVVEIINGY